jgi:hypothetical protein
MIAPVRQVRHFGIDNACENLYRWHSFGPALSVGEGQGGPEPVPRLEEVGPRQKLEKAR